MCVNNMTDLLGKKTVYLSFTGPIDSGTATRIGAIFNGAAGQGYDEVHLAMSSLGGFIGDGIFLYNLMTALPIKKVFYNIGNVSSIALVVYLAADERYCSEHSLFMTHPAEFAPDRNMTSTRAQSLLSSVLAEDARIEKILCDRTNTPTSVISDRRVKDVHIKPVEAVQYGIASQIMEFVLPSGEKLIQI